MALDNGKHRLLALRSLILALGKRLVAFLAANLGFVNLDGFAAAAHCALIL